MMSKSLCQGWCVSCTGSRVPSICKRFCDFNGCCFSWGVPGLGHFQGGLFAGTTPFLLLVPPGLHSLHKSGWFVVQRSGFSLAKIQGASGVVLCPCGVLFSVLAGCFVSGPAVAGCGCRRVLLNFGGGGRLLAGLLAA